MARVRVPKKAPKLSKTAGQSYSMSHLGVKGPKPGSKAEKLADRRSIYRSNKGGKGGGQRRDRRGRFA